MWFVSKKKYNALLEQKKDFERIAMNAVAQNGRLLEEWDAAIKEMKSIQELNRRLVARNDELLVRVKELEAELTEAKRKNGVLRKDYEVLMNDYEVLDAEYGKVEEERDHYEERCHYLEGEMEDKEELETKLDFVIRQRDYYYDLLESTSEVEEKDE